MMGNVGQRAIVTSAAPPPPTGTLIAGKYRVESLIGEGGMGIVLAAHHELLDTRVAVKLLPRQLIKHQEFVQRFPQNPKTPKFKKLNV